MEGVIVIPEQSAKTEVQVIEKWYLEYSDELLRLCYLYLGDYHLAEDALQETFIRAIKNIKGFQHESTEKTWLTRITINVCKTMLQKKKTEREKTFSYEKHVSEIFLVSEEKGIEQMLEQSSLIQSILKIKPEYREILILHYYQELKLREIARITDLPMTTVAWRLRKGKEELRKLLGGDYNEY